MRNVLSLRNCASSFVAAASFLISACAHGFGGGKPVPMTQPPQESCYLGDTGLQCYDSRLGPGEAPFGAVEIPCEQTSFKAVVADGICYRRPFAYSKNMWCTNPTDDDAQQDWIRSNCFGPPKRAQ